MKNFDRSFVATESEERFERTGKDPNQNRNQPVHIYEDYSEVELTQAELTSIEQQIQESEKDIETSIQEIKNNPQSLYFTLFSSILFIVLCIEISGISIINGLNNEAENRFEKTQWAKESYLENVQTLSDLDKYMREVYLQGISSNYISNYTSYFAGSRLTLNLYKQIENENWMTKKVVKSTFANAIVGFYGKELDTSDMNLWDYHDNEGFQNQGGYIEYFTSRDQEEFVQKWREMTKSWLVPDFASLTIESLFHNRNLKTTLLYTIEFKKGPSGYIDVFSYSSGMFYEVYENQKLQFGVIVGILVIYSIALCIQFIKISQNMVSVCKIFWSNFKIDMDFFEFIQILNVLMPMVTVIITFNLIFSNIGKYSLPLDKDGIDGMISMSRLYFTVIQVNSISCVLMMIKMTLVLKNKFPSFGVLFDTIWHSKNDLINFSIITLVLLFGFVFMGKIAFGMNHENFRNIQGSFNSLFITILSNVGYEELKTANEQLSAVYVIIYCTLFYFILLNMFIAIVISTYIEVKSQNQLMLEAKAKIVGEDAKKFIQNLYNLILFRTKNTLFEDCEEYLNLITVSKEEQNSETNEKIKQLETGISQQINKNYYAIFKFNIGQFQAKVGSGTLKTNEQVKIEITNVIREIFAKKKKIEKFKKILENDVNYNYSLIVKMFLFIIFTVLLLVTITARLKTTETNKLREIMVSVVDEDAFDEIVSEESFYRYFEETFMNNIQDETAFEFNYFFSEPRLRLTVNRLKVNENKIHFSEKEVPIYIKNQQDLIREDFRGPTTKLLHIYFGSGTTSTYDQKGGFVYDYYRDTDKTQYFSILKSDRLMSTETESLVIEWVSYNSNYDMLTYCGMIFEYQSSGLITKTLDIRSFNIELFSNKYIYVGVLEIFMGMLCLYFIYLDVIVWVKHWKKLNTQREEKQRGEWMVRKVSKILKSKKQVKGCVSILKNLFDCIFLKLLWAKDYLIQFLVSIYSFLFSSTFIFVNVVGNALCVLLFIQIIKLYTNDFIRDFEIGQDRLNLIGEIYEVSKIFMLYRIYAAFLVFITFMRILQFYNFSKDLSILTDVLNSAKFDIFFFLAMFIIILVGYSLMGYLILGTSIYDFSSMPRSLLSCYLMLLGSFDLQSIQEADPNLGMIFFGTYIVVFYLLLLNMFTAIIGAHNEQVEKESGSPGVGFFKKIYLTIRDAKCPRKPSKDIKLTTFAKFKQFETHAQDHYEKREALFDFPVSTKFFEGAEAWYNILEETLKKFSRKTVVLSEFQIIKGKKFDIFKQKPVAEIAMISNEQWIAENIDGKIDIWRTLSNLQNKNNILIKANSILFEKQATVFNISKICKQLWENTTFEDKIKMWAGKNHFTDYERISIWNSMTFSQKWFPEKKLERVKDLKWTIEIENEVWQSLDLLEKMEIAKKINDSMKGFYDSIRQGSEFTDEFFKHSTIKRLDFKELLWAALTFNHKWKLTLFLNNSMDQQAEIISFLIITDIQHSVFKLEYADETLAEYFNSSIHDKLFSECIFNAERVRKGLILEKYDEAKYDIKNLNDYKFELKENVGRFAKSKKELEKQNEILQSFKKVNRRNSKK